MYDSPIRNDKLLREAYEKGYNDAVNEQYQGIPQGMGYLKQTPQADLAPHVPPAGQHGAQRANAPGVPGGMGARGPRDKFHPALRRYWRDNGHGYGQLVPTDMLPGESFEQWSARIRRGVVNEQTGGGDYQGGDSGIIKQSNRVGSGRKPQQNLNPSAASVPPEGAVPQPYPPKLYPPYTSYFV